MDEHGTKGLTLKGVGDNWRHVELEPGEKVVGEVLRLPTPNTFSGTRLFLHTDDGVIAIPAVAAKGWTLLERALQVRKIAVGDLVEIDFAGWAETHGGERRHRLVEVRRVGA